MENLDDRAPMSYERKPDRVELEQRARWQAAIERLMREVGGPRPRAWQVELAARLLARKYTWSCTGRGDIWVMAQTTGNELGYDMQADGRLDEWGNWADSEMTDADRRASTRMYGIP